MLATLVFSGRFTAARTEQLAHLALTRVVSDHDAASGADFLADCVPRLRRELQRMVDGGAGTEPARRLRLCVDVAADDGGGAGRTVDDVVRRPEREAPGGSRVVARDHAQQTSASTSRPGPRRHGRSS